MKPYNKYGLKLRGVGLIIMILGLIALSGCGRTKYVCPNGNVVEHAQDCPKQVICGDGKCDITEVGGKCIEDCRCTNDNQCGGGFTCSAWECVPSGPAAYGN